MKEMIQEIKEQVEAGMHFVVSGEPGFGRTEIVKHVLNDLEKSFEIIHCRRSEELVAECTVKAIINKPQVIVLDEIDRIEHARQYNTVITLSRLYNIQFISLTRNLENETSTTTTAIQHYIKKNNMPVVCIDKGEIILNHPQN